MLSIVLNEAIHEFSEIKTTGHMPELVTQVSKAFNRLGLGNDIKIASLRYVQPTITEQFEVTSLFTDRAPCAFCDSAHFPFVGGKQRDDAISLTEVGMFENDRFSGISAWLTHG